MPDQELSEEDWMRRIEPALERSMQEVSEQMTNAAPVQRWLRSASYEAAMQASRPQPGDMQAEAAAYGALRDDLREHFASLARAVRDLTHGQGRLDVKWRPLSPNYTRLYIDFGLDYEIDLFVRLKAASPDEARRALDAAADALPRSEPFPNRPNERTALVALDDRQLGVRVREHQADPGRRRTVTLLPDGDSAESDVALDEAPERVVQHLTPEAGSRVDPQSWM
jgi:hypothetical protein